MRIAGIIHGSRANGPGLRTCVWLQGCQSMDCPGCQNPQTHDPTVGRAIGPLDLAMEIHEDAPEGTEGVTFSGGEPLQQPGELLRLINAIRILRPAWGFGLFTGYTEEELAAMPFMWPQIQRRLDWALCGRWDRTQATREGFAPSSNQVLRIWNPRYSAADLTRMIEFSVEEGGLTQVTGFPGRT